MFENCHLRIGEAPFTSCMPLSAQLLGSLYALPQSTEKLLREALEALGDNVPWAESFARGFREGLPREFKLQASAQGCRISLCRLPRRAAPAARRRAPRPPLGVLIALYFLSSTLLEP